jgi:hypothetical protein
VLQTKLTVNQPGDVYEQEADRIAELVMRTPKPQIQHTCAYSGACPKCQTKQSGQEQESVQTKRIQASDTGQTEVPPIVYEVLRSPGQSLNPAIRAFMEPRFGYDFSQVRIHTDDVAANAAHAVQARAYTIGRNIVFGSGEYVPTTVEGKRLLAHELTHAIQQTGSIAAAQGTPAVQRNEPKNSNVVGTFPISPLRRPQGLQRWSWEDTISLLEWTNPLTFSSKALRTLTGVELNLWPAAEQAVRASATEITIPPRHVRDLKRYANAVPDDGKILNNALAQGPSYYKGGWLLSVNSSAAAMTFGNSIFFRRSPPDVETYVHEMVHIHQYAKLGRGSFLASYFGLSLATILWRVIRGQPINVMQSSPHEDEAYKLQKRFQVWLANNP